MIWNVKNKKIEYGCKTLIMGIVNVTPDSFSDGGAYFDSKAAISHALQLEKDGADIIDIGAQSTRPGHQEISDGEEWERLSAVISDLRSKTSLPISVDTYYPYVAKKALLAGVDIINDVSGIINKEMAEIIKESGAGWIIMHSGSGNVDDVKEFFKSAVNDALSFGIDKSQICLDMGIGFGKSYEQSMSLIANIKKYKTDGFPLLLGTSRKRVIGEASNQKAPNERVYGNIAADTIAIIDGADIIRLHDVKNEKQGIDFADNIKKFIKG